MRPSGHLAAASLSFVLFSSSVLASPPRPDVMVRVERAVVTSKEKGESAVRLNLRLEAIRKKDPGKVTLDVRMLDYANGVESGERTILQRDFTAPLPGEVSVDVRVAGDTTHVIQAKVEGGVPDAGFSHVDRVYLICDEQGNVSLMTPADFKHKENLANLNRLKKKPRPPTADAAASGWPLTLGLQIEYTDSSGAKLPLPDATVEIWEDDLISDDYLGKVVLDATGKARTTVEVPFDPLGPDDVYLLIKTESSSRFTLGTTAEASKPVTAYQYRSPNRRVHQGDAPIAIVFTIANGARELGVWSRFNGTRDYISSQLSFASRPFSIWFPSSTGEDEAYFSRAYNLIAIGDSFAGSDMVIAHEFGHALMWQLNDEWLPEAGGPHSICPGKAIDEKLAWTEGYATAFALSATQSPDGVFHWFPGDNGVSIEHYDCPYHQLNTDELRVAAAIWDFVDANNDCNGGLLDRGRNGFCDQNSLHPISALDAYYNAVKGQRQETAMPYWWYLHDHFMTTDQRPLAENIMRYDWSEYTDSTINSFTCQCVDTPQRCRSSAYDFMCYWNATAHACQTSVSIDDGPWTVRSTKLVGETGGVVGPSHWYAIKVSCEGWGTVQKTLHEPPNS